jgi:hypothetical protein
MPASLQTAETETSPTQRLNDFDENYSIQDRTAENVPSDDAFVTEEPNIVIPQTSANSGTLSFRSHEPQTSVSSFKIITEETEKNHKTEAKSRPGILGRLFTGLFLLIFGGVLGAGLFYVWQNYVATRPEVGLIPQSDNIVHTSLENLKTKAINQPSKVIEQYNTSPPKDASDFYLLGTAHLSLKQYTDARNAFIDAKNKLNEVSNEENREVLAIEITQGLIIAQNEMVRSVYEKELKFTKGIELHLPQDTNQQNNKTNTSVPNVGVNKNSGNF